MAVEERRILTATRRAETGRQRWSSKTWEEVRRQRTHQLIKLGGLVHKAGLVDLTDEDGATLYGALLELAARARGEDASQVLALWKRRGKRAFDAEAEASSGGDGIGGSGTRIDPATGLP